MSPHFYIINGVSESNLKQVYTTSFPDELQNEILRAVTTAKKDLSSITIGQIHQMAVAAYDKLCEQEKFFKDIFTKKPSLKKACQQYYL